jgi:hypothetical protein
MRIMQSYWQHSTHLGQDTLDWHMVRGWKFLASPVRALRGVGSDLEPTGGL